MNRQKPPTKQNQLDTDSPEEDRPRSKKEVHDTQETGGPQGPEPTRYGDWERKGRCVDF